MKNLVIEKIGQALIQTLNLGDNFQVNVNSKLKDDLGLDSMSSLTFLMALEDTIEGFQVDPDTLEMEHLESIDTIADYVLQQQHGSIAKENAAFSDFQLA